MQKSLESPSKYHQKLEEINCTRFAISEQLQTLQQQYDSKIKSMRTQLITLTQTNQSLLQNNERMKKQIQEYRGCILEKDQLLEKVLGQLYTDGPIAVSQVKHNQILNEIDELKQTDQNSKVGEKDKNGVENTTTANQKQQKSEFQTIRQDKMKTEGKTIKVDSDKAQHQKQKISKLPSMPSKINKKKKQIKTIMQAQAFGNEQSSSIQNKQDQFSYLSQQKDQDNSKMINTSIQKKKKNQIPPPPRVNISQQKQNKQSSQIEDQTVQKGQQIYYQLKYQQNSRGKVQKELEAQNNDIYHQQKQQENEGLQQEILNLNEEENNYEEHDQDMNQNLDENEDVRQDLNENAYENVNLQDVKEEQERGGFNTQGPSSSEDFFNSFKQNYQTDNVNTNLTQDQYKNNQKSMPHAQMMEIQESSIDYAEQEESVSESIANMWDNRGSRYREPSDNFNEYDQNKNVEFNDYQNSHNTYSTYQNQQDQTSDIKHQRKNVPPPPPKVKMQKKKPKAIKTLDPSTFA